MCLSIIMIFGCFSVPINYYDIWLFQYAFQLLLYLLVSMCLSIIMIFGCFSVPINYHDIWLFQYAFQLS